MLICFRVSMFVYVHMFIHGIDIRIYDGVRLDFEYNAVRRSINIHIKQNEYKNIMGCWMLLLTTLISGRLNHPSHVANTLLHTRFILLQITGDREQKYLIGTCGH